MKRHWRYVVLSIAGVTAIAVVLASVFAPREPVFQSKPLSYWVEQLDGHGRGGGHSPDHLCHKAKGMEWENVVVAADFADLFDNTGMPLPVGTSADPPSQNGKPIRFVEKDEVNLIYVAMTRSMANLMIRSPDLNRLLKGNCG
jgi:hypothetical protein